VPEGDASEKASSSQGECSFDAETSEIGRLFRGRLFQPMRRGGSTGEQERMPVSELVDRSRWWLITPSFSRESYPREWVDQN